MAGDVLSKGKRLLQSSGYEAAGTGTLPLVLSPGAVLDFEIKWIHARPLWQALIPSQGLEIFDLHSLGDK